MNLTNYLQNRKKETGIIAGAILLAILLFFTPLFDFLKSSLLQTQFVQKDAGLYMGYNVETASSGTVLRAGTGVLLTSDSHYYTTATGTTLRVEVYSATGTGSYLADSISGVMMIETPEVAEFAGSLESILLTGDYYNTDTGATLLSTDSSGKQQLKFSVDRVAGDFAKPYQHVFTLDLKVKPGKDDKSDVKLSVQNIRLLKSEDLTDTSKLSVYLTDSTPNVTKEDLIIKPSGNIMKEAVTKDATDGSMTVVRTLYDTANKKLQEEILVYDKGGVKKFETARAFYDNGIMKQEIVAQMNDSGMQFIKLTIKDYDDTGKLLRTTTREFDPVSGDLLKEFITLADGSTMEKWYENGKLAKSIITNPDGSKEVREYAYNPDGSYSVVITKIFTDGTLSRVKQYYDKNDVFLREEVISSREATNAETILISEDKRFKATIPAGSAHVDTVFSLVRTTKPFLVTENMGTLALDGYAVKAVSSTVTGGTGTLLSELLLPYTVRIAYEDSVLPKPPSGMMYSADIYQFEPKLMKWMRLKTNFLGGNLIETTTNKTGLFTVFATLTAIPTQTFVSGSGGSGGGFTPPSEKTTVSPIHSASVAEVKKTSSECRMDTTTPATKFKDVNNHWSAMYVCLLTARGAISGYADGTFQPDRQVSRAELVKIILVASGVNVPKAVPSTSFTDVHTDNWFAPYVETAKRAGFIEGYKDGTFRPYANVNRAEALKIILMGSGVYKQKDFDEEKIAQANDGDLVAEFRDVLESSWFAHYVGIAKKAKILSGKADGAFHAGDNMTRAEVNKVVAISLGL